MSAVEFIEPNEKLESSEPASTPSASTSEPPAITPDTSASSPEPERALLPSELDTLDLDNPDPNS